MLARGFIHICLDVSDDGDVVSAKVVDTNLDSVEIDGAAEVIWDDDDRYFDDIIVNALRKEVEG